jgi:hypothetical protein
METGYVLQMLIDFVDQFHLVKSFVKWSNLCRFMLRLYGLTHVSLFFCSREMTDSMARSEACCFWSSFGRHGHC